MACSQSAPERNGAFVLTYLQLARPQTSVADHVPSAPFLLSRGPVSWLGLIQSTGFPLRSYDSQREQHCFCTCPMSVFYCGRLLWPYVPLLLLADAASYCYWLSCCHCFFHLVTTLSVCSAPAFRGSLADRCGLSLCTTPFYVFVFVQIYTFRTC